MVTSIGNWLCAPTTSFSTFPMPTRPSQWRARRRCAPISKSALGIFQLQLTVTEIYDCADPDRLVLEYTSVGSVTTTGKPYANSYIAVATFRDGLVCTQREYYNPLPAARSLSPG